MLWSGCDDIVEKRCGDNAKSKRDYGKDNGDGEVTKMMGAGERIMKTDGGIRMRTETDLLFRWGGL